MRETNPDTVDGLAWSPDGHYLAARAGDTFRVWDVWDGLKEVRLKQAQHNGEINGMVFSWDNRFMATGCQDGAVRIWDMRKPQADPLILHGHTRSIWSVTFTYDNRLLVSTGWDKQIRLWRADDGALQAILTGQTDEVWNPALSPDGRILATADSSGILRLWRIQGGGDTAHFVALSQPVTAMAMAGSEVVLAGGDGTVEVRQPRIDATRFYTTGDLRLESIAVSPDLGLLAAGSADGQIILLDAASGTRLAAWPAHDGSVRGLSFLPDGIHLASGGADRIIRLWDLRRQQAGIGQATLEIRGHENDVTALVAIRDSCVLISAGADGTVRFWDSRTGKQTTELTADGPLLAIAVSPDKRYLAGGGQGPTVQVWNVANELSPENRGASGVVGAASTREALSLYHDVPVRALTFGANASELVTGAEDGNLRLWTITDTGSGTPVLIHAHGARWVIGLGLADEGETIYSAGGDGQVRGWPGQREAALALACSRVGRNLSSEEWQTYFSFLPFKQLCPDSETALWQVAEQLDPPQARPPGGVARATVDERPIIRYFEAVPGATMAAGAGILLRWDTNNATDVHLESDGERHDVSSPHEEHISPATDKVYRLIARNNLGERTIAIKISVEK